MLSIGTNRTESKEKKVTNTAITKFSVLVCLAVAFLLIGVNATAQNATLAEKQKQVFKNLGQNFKVLNLALADEESRDAFKACINNTGQRIKDEIKAAKARREATFRKSEKDEYTAAINQAEFRNALHLDSLTSCHVRWLMLLAHYDFPTANMADIFEATPNKISDSELQTIIDDYDENFYIVISSYLLIPTVDEFLSSGPWAATEEDFQNMYDAVASGIGLTEAMKRKGAQEALETQKFMDNALLVARSNAFNKMISQDNGAGSLFDIVVTNLVDGPSPVREGVLQITKEEAITDWFMKEATQLQNYLGCGQMSQEKNDELVKLIENPTVDWEIPSRNMSVCAI